MGNRSRNYRVSLAMWDHTLLLATWHKQMHSALTPARLVLNLPTLEGWKA